MRILRKLRRGIGLIELAMGLGISGLVIAGGLVYYNHSREEMTGRDIIMQVMSLKQSVHGLYQGHENYFGLDNTAMANSGQVQRKHIGGQTGLTTDSKHPITVRASASGEHFLVIVYRVPRSVCHRLVTKEFNFINLSVRETDFSSEENTGFWNNVGAAAMNPQQANDACAYTRNTVSWRFQ